VIGPIIDNLPTAVFLLDRQMRILLANRAASALSGVTKQELTGKYSAEAIHCMHMDSKTGRCPEKEACRRCAFRSAVADSFFSRTDYYQLDTDLEIKGQGRRCFSLSTTYLYSSDTLLVALNDITAARCAEVQQRENGNLMAALETTAAVFHEIAQPLQVISGYVEMLMFDNGLKDSSFLCLQEVRKQVQRLKEISTGLQNLKTFRSGGHAESEHNQAQDISLG
jgi:nitrogen-specific signal transduction histidine kinase